MLDTTLIKQVIIIVFCLILIQKAYNEFSKSKLYNDISKFIEKKQKEKQEKNEH